MLKITTRKKNKPEIKFTASVRWIAVKESPCALLSCASTVVFVFVLGPSVIRASDRGKAGLIQLMTPPHSSYPECRLWGSTNSPTHIIRAHTSYLYSNIIYYYCTHSRKPNFATKKKNRFFFLLTSFMARFTRLLKF